MGPITLALTQHSILIDICRWDGWSLVLLWSALSGYDEPIHNALHEVLFDLNYITQVSKQLRCANLSEKCKVKHEISMLELICSTLNPARYNLTIHLFLEKLLSRIPSKLLLPQKRYLRRKFQKFMVIESFRYDSLPPSKGFPTIYEFHQRRLKRRNIPSNYQFLNHRFSPLLNITFGISTWRHRLIKQILFPKSKKRTFHSVDEMWRQISGVDTLEMNMIKDYIKRQVANIRMEMMIYKDRPIKKNIPRVRRLVKAPEPRRSPRRQNILGLYVRNTPTKERKWIIPRVRRLVRIPEPRQPPRRQELVRRYINQDVSKAVHPELQFVDKNEKNMLLALKLSQHFFGNIYRGQTSAECLQTYIKKIDRGSKTEIDRIEAFDTQITKQLQKIPQKQFQRAITLLFQRFAEFYNDRILFTGFGNILNNHIFINRSPNFQKLNLQNVLDILTALTEGILLSPLSLHIQTILQSFFEETSYEGYIKSSSKRDVCLTKDMNELLQQATCEDILRWINLACKLDLDCICLGRFLECVVDNRDKRGVFYDMFLEYEAGDRRMVRMVGDLEDIGKRVGGKRLRKVIRNLGVRMRLGEQYKEWYETLSVSTIYNALGKIKVNK